MGKVLIARDYINEIVHPKGKFLSKGYSNFIDENNTFECFNGASIYARKHDMEIIHTRLGFESDYSDQSEGLPLFGKANGYHALKRNIWAIKFNESIEVTTSEKIIEKIRDSSFYNIDLRAHFKEQSIDEVYLSGVTTGLVVQSVIRNIHYQDHW